MNVFTTDSELAALLDALTARELTEADAARLAERLAHEPTARAAYREVMAFDAMLHREFPPAEVTAALPSACEIPASQTNRWRAWAIAAAVAAAALVSGSFLRYAIMPRPAIVEAEDDDFPVEYFEEDDNTVAMVTNTAHVRRAPDLPPVERGARLQEGVLEIVAGSVEVTFDSGAVVVMEGPARLHLESEYRARLQFGRVRADVPAQAIGFLLITPGGVIRDLGTSFGVNVDAGGGTELHVIEGKVEAMPVAAPAAQAPQLVTQNQAVRFAVASLEKMKFNATQFASDLPPAPRTRPLELAHWSFDPSGTTVMKSSEPPFTLTLRRAGHPDENPRERFTAGVFGSAATFDGETQTAWSDCPGIASHAPRTVSSWVRIPADARTDEPNGIISWGRFRDGEKWQLCTNIWPRSGTVGALRQEFGAGYIIGSTDLRDGVWHHVAVVFHGGEHADVTTHVKLYVDGRLETLTGRQQQRIATTTREQSPTGPGTTFPVILGRYLGQWPSRPIFYWRGALDEVRLHRSALTPAEIVALMERNKLD